jgi:transposase-like protein
MVKDDVLFGYRLQLFAEAQRTSVAQACRLFGVHRSTYYTWKRQVDRHGLGSSGLVSGAARRCQTSSRGWSRSAC